MTWRTQGTIGTSQLATKSSSLELDELAELTRLLLLDALRLELLLDEVTLDELDTLPRLVLTLDALLELTLLLIELILDELDRLTTLDVLLALVFETEL